MLHNLVGSIIKSQMSNVIIDHLHSFGLRNIHNTRDNHGVNFHVVKSCECIW